MNKKEVSVQEEVIRTCVRLALESVGIDAIKRGPFFGIGEGRRAACLKQAA